jgi:protein phosphatase
LVRGVNEDAFLDRPQRGLWAVADGMGGHDAGDFASRMVVSALDGLAQCAGLAKFVTDARDRLQFVNRQLRSEAIARDVGLIGSTVVVLLACEAHCTYLWAGDSRIYLFRNDHLRALSRDHSQAEELRARGGGAGDEAQAASNLITRAVGALDFLELDEGTVAVADGDVFLLCSDGLTNSVSEQAIAAALVAGNCEQAADALIELALQGGGRDNITAVVIRAEDLYSADLTLLNPAL